MKRMKKRMRGRILFCVFLVVLLILVVVFDKPMKHIIRNSIDAFQFKGVEKYKPTIQKDLSQENLQKYTPVVLALMQQESHGRGGDPMQSSESAGLPPNTIKEPKKSINEGIKHFEHILAYGKQQHVDFATILQAYNMGVGYINYVAQHGGHHSEKLAKKFSLHHVNQNPNLYNCGGDKRDFRYPYCYGDFSYSDKVQATVKSLTHSVPAYLSSNTQVY